MEAVLHQAPMPVGRKMVGYGVTEPDGRKLIRFKLTYSTVSGWIKNPCDNVRFRTLDVPAFPFNMFCCIHSLVHVTVLMFTSVVQEFISFPQRFSVAEFTVCWYHVEWNLPPEGNRHVLFDYWVDSSFLVSKTQRSKVPSKIVTPTQRYTHDRKSANLKNTLKKTESTRFTSFDLVSSVCTSTSSSLSHLIQLHIWHYTPSMITSSL